jgi:hypothetical protein
MEQISEAFNKCFVADFIFSISRTPKDKQNNTGKLFVAKNRNGPDGDVYNIFMQTANVNIKVLNTPNAANGTSQVPANPVVLDSKMQKELLQKTYEKFRRKGVAKP